MMDSYSDLLYGQLLIELAKNYQVLFEPETVSSDKVNIDRWTMDGWCPEIASVCIIISELGTTERPGL